MAHRPTLVSTIARQLPPSSWAAIFVAVLAIAAALAATQ